jgi:hypothetical protein
VGPVCDGSNLLPLTCRAQPKIQRFAGSHGKSNGTVFQGAVLNHIFGALLLCLVVGCQTPRIAERHPHEESEPWVQAESDRVPRAAPAPLTSAAQGGVALPAKDPCPLDSDVDLILQPELETGGVSTRNLMTWVELLAGPGLRGREAGTRDAQAAAHVIAEYFQAIALLPQGTSGYCTRFGADGIRDQNVLAHLLPVNKNACGYVVLGAHYDALGVDNRGHIRPGADDNASGVAVLLEAARLLAVEPLPDVGVVFASFGAEERGFLGAQAYAMRPTIPLASIRLMVNVDMAGRRPSGYPTIGYQVFGPERQRTTELVRSASKRSGFVVTPARLGARGDHAAFGPTVPAVFFSTMTHADYHSPNDTPRRVEPTQVTSTLRLVLELVRGVGCPELNPG